MAVLTGLVWGASAQVFVDFQASVTLGRAPLDVSFTDNSSTGGATVTGWLWDFGDGATSTEQNPSHTYTEPGNYAVTLKITVGGSQYPRTRPRCINVPNFAAPDVGQIDLSDAVVVVNPGDPPAAEAKAPEVLAEEVLKRSGLDWPITTAMPGTATVIAITSGRGTATAPEGYTLFTENAGLRTIVWVLGNDSRGALFGTGALLRALECRPGSVVLPEPINLTTAPVYPIRGHQLGYRNTNNTCDAWDKAAYEQYIRELVIFGTNTIENVYALSPGASPHFTTSEEQMHIHLSTICADYGLDYSLWAPVETTLPGSAATELAAQEALYKKLPRLDAVFVPGGDPGNNDPLEVMRYLEDLATLLRSYFPDAELWVSNQGFEPEENDAFFDFLQTRQPSYLTGVVYGPWTKLSIAEERNRTPLNYPIRLYPDLTHNVRCQFPYKNIDRAFAHVLGREAINPSPIASIIEHDTHAPETMGFVGYSDGVHDDVNKCVWTQRAWDPAASAEAILIDYARFFFGPDSAPAVKDGILALEDNWSHPAATNTGINDTFAAWNALETAYPDLQNNWRWNLCLVRAYYDMYLRYRVIDEAALEQQAYDQLAQAPALGSAAAIANARAELLKAEALSPVQQARRTRILALCRALWDQIKFQPSTKAPYLASGLERGCIIDTIDHPVNDRMYLEHEFQRISTLPGEDNRLSELEVILHWEDPGSDGFYDDLGNPERQPHLVQQLPWEEDPGRVHSAGQEFTWHNMKYDDIRRAAGRLSWQDQAYTLYGEPLKMRYTGLYADAKYRLKVMYTGRFAPTMTCTADGLYPVHGPVFDPSYTPLEFDVPHEATSDGVLELQWDLVNGRGCQVAEVWLMVSEFIGIPGDVDHNGKVNAVDVQLVINAALNIKVPFNCDINGNGKVDAVDVQLVINAALTS
jgi:PKD repeat protein